MEILTAEEVMPEMGASVPALKVAHEVGMMGKIPTSAPRDLLATYRQVKRMAALLGEEAFYRWKVTSKDGSKKVVKGVSIDGAQCIKNLYGNCHVAVDIKVREVVGQHQLGSGRTVTTERITLVGMFWDTESGSVSYRPFIYTETVPPGRYANDPEQIARWKDLEFQKAVSKCERNIILRNVPPTMKSTMLNMAIQAADSGVLNGKSLKEVTDLVVDYYEDQFDIDYRALEDLLGVPIEEWSVHEIGELKSTVKALKNGEITVTAVFGKKDVPQPSGDVKAKPKTKSKAIQELLTPQSKAKKA